MYLIVPNLKITDFETAKQILQIAYSEQDLDKQVNKLIQMGHYDLEVYTLTSRYILPKLPKPLKYIVTAEGEILPATSSTQPMVGH